MKLPIFSDLHAHPYRDFARVLPSGLNSRLQVTLDVLDRIRAYCLDNNLRHVLFGGDLFHVRGVHRTSTYNPVHDRLRAFQQDGIEVIAVVGNHDQANLDGMLHSLEPMREVVRVIDKPTTVDVGGLLVRCVPFMEDPKEFKLALRDKRARLLLAHGGIQGAVTGPVEYRPKEEVTVKDVPWSYDFAFFGHYHKRQRMGEKRWYIGSPLQQNRGEAKDLEKGFLVYDTVRSKFRNVPLGFPEFKTATSDEVMASKPKLGHLAGHYVDVEVDIDRYKIESVEERLLTVGVAGLNPVPVATAKRTGKAQRLDVDPSMDMETMIAKYVEEYAEGGLDSEKLKAEALEILRSVA